MKRLVSILVAIVLIRFASFGASLQFSGTQSQPVSISVEPSTGLSAVYVVETTAGLSMTFTSTGAASAVSVDQFDIRGAAYSTPVDASSITIDGSTITISPVKADCGYCFKDGSRSTYFWITDYSSSPYTITALTPAYEQECDRAFLVPDGSAPRMLYYTITGRSMEIDRQITLEYTTLAPDTEAVKFNSVTSTVNLAYINGTFGVTPPLCDTYFHISGDRFLRAWGRESECTSSRFTTTAVMAITQARQTTRTADNEVTVETSSLGGSAPVEVEFEAAVSDAAIFTQWLMARDEDMEDVIYRSSDLSFNYTFTEMGTTYIQFQASDASGNCTSTSDLYSVFVGESALRCPNAFSPGATPGVNDEWKVTYKSIVSFECYIFNRWGEKMCEFHDPSQGWDGKYRGKLVPAGVYYYVIKAKGSDGHNYNLSGDINIVGYEGVSTPAGN